ncbi:MAG: PDZ domain-containing protein [Gammaproteobacteria bacterium]|nr:PDZ domain-containing protein [Gammaproteobacteria bacterium]
MLRLIPFAIILILSGIIVGLNLQATPVSPIPSLPSPDTNINVSELDKKLNQLNATIALLENKLNTEIASHKGTADQLTTLKATINKLTITQKNNATPETNITDNLILTDVNKTRLTEPQRNRNILISMGVDDENVSRIQRLAEKKEMDQLYLRNTAVREGWFGTEKYFDKNNKLELQSNIYREELGDEKYDHFLYTSQLTNRITIQSVLSDSPAEQAGLLAGDFILSYNNKRVFNWSDLTALTANGEAGESIPIEVQRNKQTLQYFIARGPLGIRLNSERVNPNLP